MLWQGHFLPLERFYERVGFGSGSDAEKWNRLVQSTPAGDYRVTGHDSYWDACSAWGISTAEPAPKFFRKVGLWILPVALRGSASTNFI